MKIAQLFILILAFLIIKPASAGLLIEPVVGYNFQDFKINKSPLNEEKSTGTSYGGRLGYQKLGFQLGLDYLNSTLNVDESDYKSPLKTSEFAGFVGFEFPILLRAYAGYIFSATGSTTADYSDGKGKQKVELSNGSGMKAGIGFTMLPFVDINVEYRKGTFSDLKMGTTKETKDTDYSSIMVGISLPFVL